ncbi:MAG: phosphohistidine phosphatase SixA [Candidatus Eisenbacteria bacterium]|nr:phosphohistidine phosphatase SixA [Candidatus Eisenbacteria bacterium]
MTPRRRRLPSMRACATTSGSATVAGWPRFSRGGPCSPGAPDVLKRLWRTWPRPLRCAGNPGRRFRESIGRGTMRFCESSRSRCRRKHTSAPGLMARLWASLRDLTSPETGWCHKRAWPLSRLFRRNPMQLFLMRHGAALSELTDPRRPLSHAGRAEVEAVARHLKGLGMRPERVVHSGKLRAMETAQIVAEVAEADRKPWKLPHLEPPDPPHPAAEIALDWSGDSMIVGHLPHLHKLARLLLGSREDSVAPEQFECAGVLCFQRVSAGAWSLRWILSPSRLVD